MRPHADHEKVHGELSDWKEDIQVLRRRARPEPTHIHSGNGAAGVGGAVPFESQCRPEDPIETGGIESGSGAFRRVGGTRSDDVRAQKRIGESG